MARPPTKVCPAGGGEGGEPADGDGHDGLEPGSTGLDDWVGETGQRRDRSRVLREHGEGRMGAGQLGVDIDPGCDGQTSLCGVSTT